MALPSEKYAVDYTDSLGLKWSKSIAQMYTTLGNIDLSAAISSFNDNLVKTVYRKSRTYNPIYDNSITYASVGHDSLVMKYFSRNAYPTDDITSGTVIVNHASPDGLSYATGVNEDASQPYNGGLSDSRVLVDTEYNKILFKVTLREMSLNTSDTPIPNSMYNDPTYNDVQLKDIDNDKWYGLFYHNGAKVWNGSGWSDANIAPVLICSGDTVQSFQGGGSAFNNLFNNYNGTMGSGQNIEFSNVASNYYWTAHNFVNRMNIENYSMGWSDSYDYKPSFADNFDAMKTYMLNYLLDNSFSPWQSVWFQLCREVHQISNDMSILLTVHCYACLDGSNNLYINWDNTYTFPIIKGSSVSKFLAGHGLYYLTDSSADLTGITPDTLHNSSAIWVGEMSADGTTTGRWIKGADIENYTGYNKDGNINNPDFDPSGGGGGGGGYDDDPWHGVSFSGVQVGGIGAFARCYYMTSTELQNLRSWMGSTSVPEGFDPMAQIIGLSQVPVALSGDDSENIQFINSSAVYDPGVTSRVVDSGVASQYSMGTPKRYSLGSINITRRMQQRGEPYLDYSCQLELYLPLIGVFSLDTQAVMGRTISAEAVLDPVSGTLAAYAWVEKEGERLPVAYGSTTIGVDLPVTAQQYSVAKAALKQANAQLGTSLLSSALTMIASASASGKAASGGRSGASVSSGIQPANNYNPYSQAASLAASQTMLSQTGNVFGSFMDWGRTIRQLSYGNNTAVAGSFGGSAAQWSYPFEAYVKIIRPRFEKPTNYNHSQGVPCVKSMTVGSCTGLIQCLGADVSGITRATDLERQAIQAALTNGVFAGGGQS